MVCGWSLPCCELALLVTVAFIPGCRVSAVAATRDLGCELEHIPFPKVVALCKRVEHELEYSRGGHAIVWGYLGYWCTTKTIETLFCEASPLPMEELHSMFALIEQNQLSIDTRLNVCLMVLYEDAQNAALPKEQRNPMREIACH
jgi:hypothetical protein